MNIPLNRMQLYPLPDSPQNLTSKPSENEIKIIFHVDPYTFHQEVIRCFSIKEEISTHITNNACGI